MSLNSPVYKKPTKRHLPEGVTHGKVYRPMLARVGIGQDQQTTKIMFKEPSRALHPTVKFPLGVGYSELWRTVRVHNLAFETRVDPFSVSLSAFLRMSAGMTRKLQAQVGATYAKLLKKEWGDGVKQLVICDGEVVYRTNDEEEILSETIDEEARNHDKPCYAFAAPAVIEESAWLQVSGDDYYPTIDVELDRIDPLGEGETSQPPIHITADFDTGNVISKLFSAEEVGILLGPISALHWEPQRGPWGDYRFIRKPAILSVRDENGGVHQLRCSVQLVEKWEIVQKNNPTRKGFVGRDLLRRLAIRVELNPATRRTSVFPASA